MELDLLGLGLPPATAGHADSAVQQQADPEKAGSDEPLRLAAATAETPPPVRARMRMRRRPVDTEDQDVPAPPASRRPKPAQPPSPQVRVPGAAGDRSPRASQLGFFRGMFPSAPGDLAAAGHAQVHARATIAPPPPPLLGLSAPDANGFGRPPPFAAWPIFEGSPAVSSGNPDHPTAPMTFIYAGAVRAFDSVPVEQAEKILYMTTKEAQATETPAFQMPQPAAAQQMMMLLGLANANDSLLPKRTASLARFLHKRKQRVECAAAMPYPCGEAALPVPSQMDNSTAVHALDKAAPFGDVEQPWEASEDGPKSMKENHGEEEAVNTDLKM